PHTTRQTCSSTPRDYPQFPAPFSLITPRLSTSTLFPYTTLFRSQHMNALAAKAYQEEFAKSADFVVMFISGESFAAAAAHATAGDRKSTRLNSSHGSISYAVFCLKKKTKRGARMAQ